MDYSITIGNKNTWDDWRLIPSSRPIFNSPELKSNIIEIPGGNGVLDISEALTGYPTYSNRVGTFKFIIDTSYKPTTQVYSEMMEYIHGKRLQAILKEDPNYYYVGRFTIGSVEYEDNFPVIPLSYNVEPFKLLTYNSLENALQNKMFKNISVASSDGVEKTFKNVIGIKPVIPTFNVKSTDGAGMDIAFTNPELNIKTTVHANDGTNVFYDIVLSDVYGDNEITMIIKGYGTLSIEFRSGGL